MIESENKPTSACFTSKLETVNGPKRLRYRNNRQAAAERQFLALQDTKPKRKETTDGNEEKVSA